MITNMKNKKKTGFLVTYSTGSYDDYRESIVAVYMNKEDAEKRCKEINEHFNNPKKPEWDLETWYEIDEAYSEAFDEPTTVGERYPRIKENKNWKDFDSKEDFDKYLHEKYEEQDRLHEDIVMKFFPNWTREKAREQIDLQEHLDYVESEEYGGASIEEITVYE